MVISKVYASKFLKECKIAISRFLKSPRIKNHRGIAIPIPERRNQKHAAGRSSSSNA